MNYTNSNGMLNIALVSQKVDEIVFDYIDSKPNWEKAHKQLDILLEESTSFFISIVNKEQKLPSLSTYWNLFLELNSKLIYFTTLALQKCDHKSVSITNDVIAKRLEIAALCLTNVQSEESEQFIEEIKATFEEVAPDKTFNGTVDRDATKRLEAFYDFAKEY